MIALFVIVLTVGALAAAGAFLLTVTLARSDPRGRAGYAAQQWATAAVTTPSTPGRPAQVVALGTARPGAAGAWDGEPEQERPIAA